MAIHVDVVKNDWLAGVQYPLATFTLEESGDVTVKATHPDRWQNLLDELNAEKKPSAALAKLHERINGSYLFATKRHDDSACPFHAPVYLQGEEASGSTSAVPA